ncbi:hypothetical protein [Variovorax soli]|uniref:hypothetical protein n=1 Tax=Variovorax soli TaxID=376815 RepID=UPI000838813D|nr:hypothetical protein [Variovorax soli]
MIGTTALARPASATASGMAKVRVSTTGRLFISVMLILILEGAIRKWISNSATVPLVLLRDLLAAYVVVYAFTHGHFRRQRAILQVMVPWSACVLGWGLLQLTLGESSFPVLLIGLRFWLLYLWFGLAAAAGMSERDYIAAVRVLMVLLLLMAPLVVLQRNSPPSAFINKSLDEDVESIFLVIADVVRTTGTFSFTSGFANFLSICTPFALGALEARKPRMRHRVLALMMFGALVVCALVSGSRAAVVYVGGTLVLYLLGNLVFAPLRRKGIALVAAVLIVVLAGSLAFIFQDAVEAIQQRFEIAAQSENFLVRIASTFLGEPGLLERSNWLGAGIGVGSNLAQYVQTGARAVFIPAETEAGRTLVEGGLVGGLFVFLKVCLILLGLGGALKRSMQTRAVFPTLVWVGLALALLTWPAIGQLTANGMLGVLLGLGVLCLRYPRLRLFE